MEEDVRTVLGFCILASFITIMLSLVNLAVIIHSKTAKSYALPAIQPKQQDRIFPPSQSPTEYGINI